MKRISENDILEDFTFDTPYNTNLSFKHEAAGKFSIFFFLRFWGCILSQYEVMQLKSSCALFRKLNVHVFVVLQSAATTIAADPELKTLPYTIICDSEEKLYRRFAVEPAATKEILGAGSTMEILRKAKDLGFVHGKDEGNQNQLPAVFIISPDFSVCYAYYGKNGGDIPNVTELSAVIKQKTLC